MDGATFRDRLEREHAERLDELGSPELLLALSSGNVDEQSLLEAAANSEYSARRTFDEWAADEPDGEAREAFESTAEQERRHYEQVAAELPASFEPADGGPLHAYLRGRKATIQRVAAGMVGRSVVSLRTHARLIEFFDAEREQLFRDLRTETEETLEQGLSLLETRCTGGDWEHAEMVAGYVIRVAHDDYTDSISALESDGSTSDPSDMHR